MACLDHSCLYIDFMMGACNFVTLLSDYVTVAVCIPPGYETLQKIEECSCQNTLCYRADHFQSFSELVAEHGNNTTLQKKRRERVNSTCPLVLAAIRIVILCVRDNDPSLVSSPAYQCRKVCWVMSRCQDSGHLLSVSLAFIDSYRTTVA